MDLDKANGYSKYFLSGSVKGAMKLLYFVKRLQAVEGLPKAYSSSELTCVG